MTNFLGKTTILANADLDTLANNNVTALANAATALTNANAALASYPTANGRTVAALNTYLLHNATFNVGDYGAVGDGATDDTAAIQAAITASLGGGQLTFQPGKNYKVTGAPTIGGSVNLTVIGYGSAITLSGVNATALKFTGGATNTNLKILGMRVIGSGVIGDNQQAIGTDLTPAANTIGVNILVADCIITGVCRGVYISVAAVNDTTNVVYRNNSLSTIVGTASGNGYGLVFSGILGGSITGNTFDLVQRHSCYVSVSSQISVIGNYFRRHRNGIGTNSQTSALVIARSANITAQGNTFDTCTDGAVSIEPHETNAGQYTRQIVLMGNTFLNSVGQDIYVDNSAPNTSSELSDVLISGNTISRTEGAAVNTESIRVYAGIRVRILDNTWYMPNAYTLTKDIVYLSGAGGSTVYTDQVEVSRNTFFGTVGGGGLIQFVDMSAGLLASAQKIALLDNRLVATGGTIVLLVAGRTSTTVDMHGNTVNGSGSDDGTAVGGTLYDSLGGFAVRGTTVVGKQATGWTVMTGTPVRATKATATVTLAELAGIVMALQQDLGKNLGHGLIDA